MSFPHLRIRTSICYVTLEGCPKQGVDDVAKCVGDIKMGAFEWVPIGLQVDAFAA